MKPQEYAELYAEIERAVSHLRFTQYSCKNGVSCERGEYVHIQNILKFIEIRNPKRWNSSTILRRINEMPKKGRLKTKPGLRGLYALV